MSSQLAPPAFLNKLWSLLENYTKRDNLVTWTREGRAFAILNKEEFCSTYLPRYFRHSQLNSFIRQLNMYGFKKVRCEEFELEYEHQLFRQNKKELLNLICRKNYKKKMLILNRKPRKLKFENSDQQQQPKTEPLQKEELEPGSTPSKFTSPQYDDNINTVLRKNQYLKCQKDIFTPQKHQIREGQGCCSTTLSKETQEIGDPSRNLQHCIPDCQLGRVIGEPLTGFCIPQSPAFEGSREIIQLSVLNNTFATPGSIFSFVPNVYMIPSAYLLPFPGAVLQYPAMEFQP